MSDTTGQNNRTHEWYEDLLGAYALDALLPDEKAEFEAYLATSPSLQAELRDLQLGVRAYALVAEERDPGPELRDRLWAAISTRAAPDVVTTPDLDDEGARMDSEGGPASDSRPAFPAEPPEQDVRSVTDENDADSTAPPHITTSTTATRPPVSLVDVRSARGWVVNPLLGKMAAALAVLIVGSLLAWNFSLRSDNNELKDQTQTLAQFSPFDPAADTGAGGEVQYRSDDNVLTLAFHDLPELAPGEVYQLWFISGTDAPVPSVVFTPGSAPGGETTVAIVGDPDTLETLAITREPGPVGSAAPTNTPILAATI